jgi:hypothetical protein
MRDFAKDIPKTPAMIKRDEKKVCKIDGCKSSVTHMQGPGEQSLCRDHQVQQREYGGLGRLDRPWTFHRGWQCYECGRNMLDEVRKKFPTLEDTDEDKFYRLARNRIIGDHQQRQAHGGDHSADNIRSLCLECNSDKTILNEDYK